MRHRRESCARRCLLLTIDWRRAMPDKPPADRTVTAPSDAAPRTADSRSPDALLKHIGGLLQRRPWYQLPRFLAYGKLVEIRN